MCYSATASFAAFGVLTTVGVASLVVAKKEDRLVASIPLIFGIQQGFEGMQWLALNAGTTSCVAGYGFNFFASLFWPVFIPLAVWSIERHRRTVFGWLTAIGIVVSAYTAVFLFRNPLVISVVGQSISYDFSLAGGKILIIGYLLATLGSLILSENRHVRWYGLFAALTAAIAGLVSQITFASVWCFYCAVLSGLIFWFVWKRGRSPKTSTVLQPAK